MKIIGPWTSPTIYSENPGTVELVSSDPSVATVDASVVIPGTRVWRNGLKHGQYLARENCLQARDTFALFLEINTANLLRVSAATSTALYHNQTMIGSIRADAARRWNWGLQLTQTSLNNPAQSNIYWRYLQSNTSSSSESLLLSGAYAHAESTSLRLIMTCDGTAINFYWSNGTAADSAHPTGRTAPTGTMGGSEFFFIATPGKYAKMEGSLPSQAQREAFMSSGALPSGLAASYQGGHEINPATPRFYDTSGNALDLSDVDVTYWPEAAASGDYTDDPLNPVVPFQPFVITPISAGTFTITARRRRQGVPDRTPPLPDEELYEETSETFTITEMPVEVAQYVRLMITTNREGTVVIASSDPAVVTFPASVVVGPTLQYEVLGTVVGAGTSTITTTMDGTLLDTTTVTIEAEPTKVKCGPSQDIRSRI